MALTRLLLAGVLAASLAEARGVRALFDAYESSRGPFPTDLLAVPDEQQKTRVRINMPLPDCSREASSCAQLGFINQFDGFSLQPRIRVRFSGPVNPDTLREGIRVVWMEQLTRDEYGLAPVGHRSYINEVVYDPSTYTAYAKPDEVLDQTRRFAVIVTDQVKDLAGDSVEVAPEFTACLSRTAEETYCRAVSEAVRVATPASGGINPPFQVVSASVFTTMSATSFLEKARQAMQVVNPSFARAPGKNVFTPSEIQGIEWRAQVRTTGDKFTTIPFPASSALLSTFGVGRIAFGSYRTGRYIAPEHYIPAHPTAAALPAPTQVEEIPFHVFLPARPMPAGGYPVAIAGHGFGGSRLDVPTGLIPGLVGAGFAVIGINAAGHGLGPEGTLDIRLRNGDRVSLPFGGRGADVDGDGVYENLEGALVLTADVPVALRDTLRQTAVDLMQLTRAIRMGMDLDGDGTVDLSQSQVVYAGVSLGSFYGSLLHAVEPDIPAAVLNVGGGSILMTARLSETYQELVLSYLRQRMPALVPPEGGLNAALPLRFEPVRIVQSPDALALHDEYERLEWIETPGAPYAYAPHFVSSTLPGVPIKRTLFQFAVGDRSVPNPSSLLLLRASHQWDSAVMFRADEAKRILPLYPSNPHSFIAEFFNPVALPFSLAAQQQMGQFLASGSSAIPAVDREYVPFFQPVTYMLEQLNFGPR